MEDEVYNAHELPLKVSVEDKSLLSRIRSQESEITNLRLKIETLVAELERVNTIRDELSAQKKVLMELLRR